MRIGILGAGAMAGALASGWAGAGHEVRIGARSAERAAALAGRLGAASGTFAEAAGHGEVILLALPPAAVAEALTTLRPVLAGRTLIDCTAAWSPGAFTDPPGSFTLAEPALAELHARLAPDAHIVKAFNVCAAEVWRDGAREFGGERLAVPLCGDDPDAKAAVSALVTDLGLHPIDGGGLARARYLEAMAAFVIGLWFAGQDPRAAIPPPAAAIAT